MVAWIALLRTTYSAGHQDLEIATGRSFASKLLHALNNIKDYVGRLKEKKKPMVLNVNGRAALVVQDAVTYQEILERLERAETIAAVRRSMEQAERGEGIPLTQAEARLRKKHGFKR